MTSMGHSVSGHPAVPVPISATENPDLEDNELGCQPGGRPAEILPKHLEMGKRR